MIPEKGLLRLGRRLSVREVMEAGVWPPVGVESMLVWDFDMDISKLPELDFLIK